MDSATVPFDMPETLQLDHREFAALSAELIADSGGLRFRAHGHSMSPSIRNGDILVIKKIPVDGVDVGDIVLAGTENSPLLAHRIIRRTGNAWITCGDALTEPDAPLDAERLIGRVEMIERDGASYSLQTVRRRLAGWLWARAARLGSSLPGKVMKRLLRLTS